MTEWFAAIGEVAESEAFREEDNRKADRLEALYQMIALPYERPEKFSARDLTDKTPAFIRLLQERGSELCAIRLVPKKSNLPKLRNRGLSLRECYETWFFKQQINPDDYIAYVCPHLETLRWSATFVVNNEAIFGEIIRGLHSQLTHGDTVSELYQFRYDFQNWEWSEHDPAAEQEVKRMITLLKVDDSRKQRVLQNQLHASFSHGYLNGYFEATVWPDNNVYYIDYNRVLPRYIPTPTPLLVGVKATLAHELWGMIACAGRAEGRVVVVSEDNLATVNFYDGAVLVCDNTDVRYLPLMRQARAIVTNRGGMLSHAAIIARELKKPCIIGTKNATTSLYNGDSVDVDATRGVVRMIKRR